ncbi:hypothetical protein XA68_14189 [Ophiocordyceps unilateralis]|uniref:Uncharacterized protein n=1 Tax=Ophiocordyceps unilateralis TaxID=268505 RepID=A0A2A9PAZ4_OPHUN|nr:hypothetical protein XA68_14189 [Ophiocordyceps unilateralis]
MGVGGGGKEAVLQHATTPRLSPRPSPHLSPGAQPGTAAPQASPPNESLIEDEAAFHRLYSTNIAAVFVETLRISRGLAARPLCKRIPRARLVPRPYHPRLGQKATLQEHGWIH